MRHEKSHVWVKAITKNVVSKFLYLFIGTWIHVEQNIYFKLIGDHLIYSVLYVDDMLMTWNWNGNHLGSEISSLKINMMDIGVAYFILGREIKTMAMQIGNSS